MFNSERALRQGDPVAALPFANRALDLLKEAQQATRIFLQRTGSNLPPIDFSRRLSGDRDDIAAGALITTARDPADATAATAWQALEDRPGSPSSVDLGALDRWVRQNGARFRSAGARGRHRYGAQRARLHRPVASICALFSGQL